MTRLDVELTAKLGEGPQVVQNAALLKRQRLGDDPRPGPAQERLHEADRQVGADHLHALVRVLKHDAVGQVDQKLAARHQVQQEAVGGGQLKLVVQVGRLGVGVAAAVAPPVDVVPGCPACRMVDRAEGRRRRSCVEIDCHRRPSSGE